MYCIGSYINYHNNFAFIVMLSALFEYRERTESNTLCLVRVVSACCLFFFFLSLLHYAPGKADIQGWVVHRVTFFHRKHFCRLNSSQACSPAPVDGIRAQDRPFSCTSASVPFRGPARSIRGRSEVGVRDDRNRNEIEWIFRGARCD